VFSLDPIDAPIDWLDSDYVICVYCRSMSVPRLYNEGHEVLGSERIGTRSTEEYKRSACEDFTYALKTLYVLQHSDVGSVLFSENFIVPMP
jgi:hypothetical protein